MHNTEDREPGEDANVEGDWEDADDSVSEVGASGEQNSTANSLTAQISPAVRTARRQLASFLFGPHDAEGLRSGCTREQTQKQTQARGQVEPVQPTAEGPGDLQALAANLGKKLTDLVETAFAKLQTSRTATTFGTDDARVA